MEVPADTVRAPKVADAPKSLRPATQAPTGYGNLHKYTPVPQRPGTPTAAKMFAIPQVLYLQVLLQRQILHDASSQDTRKGGLIKGQVGPC